MAVSIPRLAGILFLRAFAAIPSADVRRQQDYTKIMNAAVTVRDTGDTTRTLRRHQRQSVEKSLEIAAAARERSRREAMLQSSSMMSHAAPVNHMKPSAGHVSFAPCHEVPFQASYNEPRPEEIRLTSRIGGKLAKPTKHLTIGCMIGTYHGKRQNLLDQLATWAQHCDKVYAFSDETWAIPELGFQTIEVHPDIGSESIRNLWRKTQKMWKHMRSVWASDKLDFLLAGGDDSFFVMPNVRRFLEDKRSTEPRLFGHTFDGGAMQNQKGYRFPLQYDAFFVSGAGYVVNRPLVDVAAGGGCDNGIFNTSTAAEDVMLKRCLEENGVNISNVMVNAHVASDRFCPWGICRLEPDVMLYHHIAGHSMYELYNNVYAGETTQHRTRVCAPSATNALTWQTHNEVTGWTPRWFNVNKEKKTL